MQTTEEKKIKRLQAIENEVQQLHPILKKLLPKIPSIKSTEYTHGTAENGADFVLEKIETGLDITTYVGVIVKCGNIAKAEIPAISSQIEQCEMERYFQGGKKKITLSEIWVLTNGTISPSAQEFIHHKYSSQTRVIPILCTFKELSDKYEFNIESLVNKTLEDHKELIADTKNKFLISLDAAPQTK